jgi:hypothetical protein
MLFREDPDGLIVIAQPAHAWVSGQLARAWGNERFPMGQPREDVCLGAEQHDNGWIEWEQGPTLNPRTGRPHRFFEMPTPIHVGLWSSAGRRELTQSRYAALLVSLHGTGLYERRDRSHDSPEELQLQNDLLAREQSFQQDLLASLRDDPAYAALATPEAVQRNRRLVALWDRLSLALCGGLRAPLVVQGVPAADADATLTLTSIGDGGTRVVAEPWPFATPEVTLVVEGRRLPETFSDQEAMRAALARAPWVSIQTTLAPA